MNESIIKLLKSPWTIPVAVGVVSFGSGGGLGYFLASRRMSKRIRIERVARGNAELVSDQLQLDFSEEIEKIDRALISGSGRGGSMFPISGGMVLPEHIQLPAQGEVIPEHIQPQAQGGIFSNTEIKTVNLKYEDGWDYEKEVSQRGDDPYIIHYDEYMNDEMGYAQSTLTYFERDNIMCDEFDVPMYDHEKLVGELKFGYGSNDANVVYVRNPRLKCEWEILYSSSSYEQEVLGLVVEDDLSSKGFKHGVPRFKLE